MLPNRFPDAGETAEYNTVDATLWFLEALRAYLAYTGDLDFLQQELYTVLGDTIAWHVRGTMFGGLCGSAQCGRARRATTLDRREGRRLGRYTAMR
jgi:glycogen debranching enzyme